MTRRVGPRESYKYTTTNEIRIESDQVDSINQFYKDKGIDLNWNFESWTKSFTGNDIPYASFIKELDVLRKYLKDTGMSVAEMIELNQNLIIKDPPDLQFTETIGGYRDKPQPIIKVSPIKQEIICMCWWCKLIRWFN